MLRLGLRRGCRLGRSLMLWRGSLGCTFRVRRSSLTLRLFARLCHYGFDFRTRCFRFGGRLRRARCAVCGCWRRSSMLGVCCRFCSRLFLSRLILRRATRSFPACCSLVLSCLRLSRPVFRSPVFRRLGCSSSSRVALVLFGSVLRRLRLSRPVRFSLVLGRLSLGCLVLLGSVFRRLGLGGLIFVRLILGRLSLSRLVLFSLVLRRPMLGGGLVRCYDALTGKLSRLGRCGDCRAPGIDGSE